MYKYREVVYDILTDLKQIYDDKTITEYHVLWYVSTIGSKLIKQHLDNEYTRTSRMSGRYLSIFPEVDILTASNNSNIVKGRKYVQIPGILLDFDYDRAVNYVTYSVLDKDKNPAFQDVTFQRTTPAIAQLLNATFEKPSPTNPYFYTVGDIVYFLGLETLNVEKVEMGLFLGIDPRAVASMEDDCPIPTHLLDQLKYQILNLGRFVLSVPTDKVNDGNDTIVASPAKPIETQNEQQ